MNEKTTKRPPFLKLPRRTAELLDVLSESALKVLVAMCDKRKFRSDEVVATNRLLAMHASLSDVKFVARGLQALAETGLIEVISEARKGRGQPGRYRVIYDADNTTNGHFSEDDDGPDTDDANGDTLADSSEGNLSSSVKRNTTDQKTDQPTDQATIDPFALLSDQNTDADAERKASGFQQDLAELQERLEPVDQAVQQGPELRVELPPFSEDGVKVYRFVLAELDKWAQLPADRGGRAGPGVGGMINVTDPRETKPLRELTSFLLNAKPVQHVGRTTPLSDLLPEAVKSLVAKGKAFTSVGFACGCVRREFAELGKARTTSSNGNAVKTPATAVVYGRRMA